MMTLNPISKEETARYMGIKGIPDSKTAEIIERCEILVRKTVRPEYVYRKTTVEFSEKGVKLGGMRSLLTGEDIKKHLSGCSEAVVMAVTLSAEADKLIRRTAVTDMAEALAVDCLCSSAVEQVCERAEREIFDSIKAEYRTWRYSAGYGDFPIDIQRDFLDFLNAQRRIGLTATADSLLIPSKSVTAVIGISENPVNHGKKGCESCRMKENCAFSATGRNCRDSIGSDKK